MLISDLELLNYRNYEKLSILFPSGLNVIMGNNGVGKTNIVEAIDLLTYARSFRASDTKSIIKHGEEKAIVSAIVHSPSRNSVVVEISKRSKKASVNNKTLPKISSLSKYVSTTTFSPDDVLFFDDAPARRRKYMDTNIAKSDEIYFNALVRYEKLLKERNALLKDESNLELVSLLDAPLLKEAQTLVEYRTKFIKQLNFQVNEILAKLGHDFLSVRLTYNSSLGDSKNIEENGLKTLLDNRRKDFALNATTVGPHRDDIEAKIGNANVKDHASQGQKRLIAIALSLAPYFMEKEEHKKPIIILDDVLSELDDLHQEKLIDLLLKCNQVFITTTSYNYFAHAIYIVEKDKGIRRIEQ